MSSPSSKLPNLTTKTEEFITMLEESVTTPIYKLSPVEARGFLDTLQVQTRKHIEADVTDRHIFTDETGNIELRVVRPAGAQDKKLPVVLYIHGGGWVMGGKESFDMLIRKIANKTNSMVVFPNYALSPENQYPVALNQVYATLNYVYQRPQEFNADESRIVIAGDSAGGNMAACTAIMAHKQNGPKLSAQVLLYPVTNADMDTDSYNNFKDGPWLTKKAMEWFWDAYLPDKKERESIFVSPLKAKEEDLAGLPKALVVTDENDVLRDEGEAYARKLDMSGVETLNIRTNGTIHDFLMLNALADTMPAKGTLEFVCSFIKCVLNE